VPSAAVADGLLDWPARGPLVEDTALLGAARTAWRTAVPAAEAPVTASTVLWAGPLDHRTVVVLQALDRSGHPRLAQLSGRSPGTLRLTRAEPLPPRTAVLFLRGPAAPVRLLVAPETQVAAGLRTGPALAATPVDTDGVSRALPAGTQVALLGLDPAARAASPAHVLYRGQATGATLTGHPDGAPGTP
jgi:hypothetical protein